MACEFFEISNGSKIARIAPILTILGRNRSRRRDLVSTRRPVEASTRRRVDGSTRRRVDASTRRRVDASTRRRVDVSTQKFRRRENFRNKHLGRRDRFRPRSVGIGAILAFFKPFEVLKIHLPLLGEFSRSSRELCGSDKDSHKSRDDQLNSPKSGV